MDLTRYIRVEFPRRFKRPDLSVEQMGFLQGFAPFSLVLNSLILTKVQGRIRTQRAILPSVLMADIIVRSNWGQLKPAEDWNNLGMLKKDSIPKLKHKTKKWDGLGKEEPYRVYESWYEFCIDMSDHYAFSGFYDEMFSIVNSDEQLKCLAEIHGLQSILVYDKIEVLVADYGLTEFDFFSVA